ncbi:MAG: flippase-like domain-containing protein [Anaerolineales bacterium]|nr:flippase-like domain-containing protein [Anaerolineales bacterium]
MAKIFRLFNDKLYIFLKHYIRLVLGILITILALYLGLRTTSIGEITAAFSNTNFVFVFLALLSVAVNTLGKMIRWKILMSSRGRSISMGKILASLLVGQMLNTLSFARIGDVSRIYIIGSMGIGKVFTLSTLLVEKLLDTLAYTFLFLVLLLLVRLPDWITQSGYTFLIIGCLLTIILLIAAFRAKWILTVIKALLLLFPEKFQLYFLPRVQTALEGLELLKNIREIWLSSFWSAIIWSAAIITNHLALIAMDIYLPITASIFLLLGLQAGISIPSTPGRIGVFQYICVLVLVFFGISQANAFSYGILLHVLVLFPTTLSGLIIFWILGRSKFRGKPIIVSDHGIE